jgi:acetyl esterase/lipase
MLRNHLKSVRVESLVREGKRLPMKTKLISGLLVLLCAGAIAQPAATQDRVARSGDRLVPAFPKDTKKLLNIAYVTNGHQRQKLDLFVPPGATNPLPLIIWVHGGAWQGGSKENPPALRFLQRGYAVASLNYRLSQHAIFPAQIEDCKAAVRWLRAHAGENNLDPQRFAVWGASAGGHLAALLGTAGDVKALDVGENLEFSSRVQAVVDFFGPTDLTQMSKYAPTNSPIDHDATNAPEALLVGGAVQENKDKCAKANPVTYVTADDPPFLIMHGDKDNLVPYQQSELLRDALQKAGVPVTFKLVEGAGHGFGGGEIDRQVTEFFDAQLKPGAKPSH